MGRSLEHVMMDEWARYIGGSFLRKGGFRDIRMRRFYYKKELAYAAHSRDRLVKSYHFGSVMNM
jgi:hypothetical protein